MNIIDVSKKSGGLICQFKKKKNHCNFVFSSFFLHGFVLDTFEIQTKKKPDAFLKH